MDELREQVSSLGREVDTLRHRLREKQDEVAALKHRVAGGGKPSAPALPLPAGGVHIDITASDDTLLGQLVGVALCRGGDLFMCADSPIPRHARCTHVVASPHMTTPCPCPFPLHPLSRTTSLLQQRAEARGAELLSRAAAAEAEVQNYKSFMADKLPRLQATIARLKKELADSRR